MSMLATIWRSLSRFHKLLASILVMEYALSFAIVVVAVNVLMVRVDASTQSSGIDSRHLYVLQGRGLQEAVHRFQIEYGMKLFQAFAGDKNVTVTSSLPFLGKNAIDMQARAAHGTEQGGGDKPLQVNVYDANATTVHTLGIRLVSGRNFYSSEISSHSGDKVHTVILSQRLAERLFHGSKSAGRLVEINGHSALVVGVVSSVAAPNYLGGQRTKDTMLIPKVPSSQPVLAIRYDGPPGALFARLHVLQSHDAGKVDWWLSRYSDIQSAYFKGDRSAATALGCVVVIVMIVALCGLIGLTSYWVSRRRPQIAIRRAMGARKTNVTAYFLMESGVLVFFGLLLGCGTEIGIAGQFGVLPTSGNTLGWLTSVALVAAMGIITVFVSLRRWLRMDPASLMRSM